MSKLQAYIDERKELNLQELIELLKIPSVSTDPKLAGEVGNCARRMGELMAEAGLETEIFETDGHPIVYGERLEAPGAPTVLVYGHYDVQPSDPDDEWESPPFEPTERDGYLFARGATDDKGQFYALIKGIQASREVNGKLPCNVKVLCEGEEEVGSPNLDPFIRKELDRLACDVVFISDCSQFGIDMPAITYGLKGLCYLEVFVRGPATDLHSGSFGGAVANPANVLTRLMAACQGPDGKIAIPGFYDDVRPLEDWEREMMAELPFDEEEFRKSVGAVKVFGEAGYTTLERKGARPTLDINGMISGFTGEGAKTVLPATASCKFSMRLVPDQDPEKIATLVCDFLNEIAPDTVEIEVRPHHGASPVIVSRDGTAVKAAEKALETGFGRQPVFVREGGSIPVVNTFQEALGAESLLIGLGLPDDQLHAPNEHFRIKDYHRGAVTMAAFLEEYGQAGA